MQSLFEFLRINPYADVSRFKRDISGPLQRGGSDSVVAFDRLRVVLKAVMLRRTKQSIGSVDKDEHEASSSGESTGKKGVEAVLSEDASVSSSGRFSLPKKSVVRVQVELSTKEAEFYNMLESRVQRQVKRFLKVGHYRFFVCTGHPIKFY